MARRVERFALQSVARDILPDSRTAKCLRIRAHDRDVQVWKSRSTRLPAMVVCKPAAASGCVQSAVQRWWNVAGVKYSRQWPSIAPVAAKCIC